MSNPAPHGPHDPAAGAPAEDYEDLYEHAPCGYLSIRPNGRIAKLNATFSGWIGYPASELIGKRFHDLLTVAGRIFFETHFAPLLRMQGFFNEVALDLVTKTGGRLPVLVNAAERRDAAGRHLFTRITVFNATDRRRYERELLQARAGAEAGAAELAAQHAKLQASLLDERGTSALREQFIAVLGHDLRNPLASIDAGMQLLLRTPLEPRAASVVGMVRDSVARMAALIDNVMDFARGRLGGGIQLERAAVPLEPVLRQVVAELQAVYPDRVIETRIARSEPVYCDRGRIGQLVSNLLGNALTHGAADRPVRLDAATTGSVFELSIANAGQPIPPAMLQFIFEPFARGSHGPNQQGLGLGLHISREIARAHGGTLVAQSTDEETRFTFRMDVRPQDAVPAEPIRDTE